MLYGQIKPVVVKLFKSRFRYRRWRLPLLKPLRVIGWDMKAVLVADDRVVRVYRIPWKDVQLMESERILQVPIIQSVDRSKVVDRRKEKKPFFRAGQRKKN